MQDKTIEALFKLNQNFYNITAKEFDTTRAVGWQGWEDMWSVVNEYYSSINCEISSDFSILDVGCGNGRLVDFLFSKGYSGKYFGLDNNLPLLNQAQLRLEKSGFIGQTSPWDISHWYSEVKNTKKSQVPFTSFNKPNLVTLFGVIHHVPSYELRLELIRTLVEILPSSGLICFTTWDFIRNPRLLDRSLKSGSDIEQEILKNTGLMVQDMESQDYILDWKRGQGAYRYVHYFDEQEIQRLFLDTDLEPLKCFSPSTGDVLNKYFICKRKIS